MMPYAIGARDELFFHVGHPHCFILGMENTFTENNYRLLSTIEIFKLCILYTIFYSRPPTLYCTSSNKEIFLNNFVSTLYKVIYQLNWW